MRSFFCGLIVAAAAASGLSWFLAVDGLLPINADAPPSALERWVAHVAVIAGVQRHMQHGLKPPVDTDAILDGVRVYKANCEICHGDRLGAPSTVARGLYQRPPQFAKDGAEDLPFAYTVWVIAHGIRLTGMPAFSSSLSQSQITDVAGFLGRMNALTSDERFAWAGRPLVPPLRALYRIVGGERACTYLPSPNARPHHYRSDARVTPDGTFIIVQFYNRGISELAIFGSDAKNGALVRASVDKSGTALVAKSPRVGDAPVWRTIAGTAPAGAVTTITSQTDGSYRFRSSSDPGSGACAASASSSEKAE